MACPTFTVTVKDVKAALAKVKKAIADAKGSFSGDETKGSYSVSGDGFISGAYTIKAPTPSPTRTSRSRTTSPRRILSSSPARRSRTR